MMQRLPVIKDRTAVDAGILFSVLVILGIVALGTALLRFEIATPPPNDSGFFYDWQLANPTFWGRATAWIGFAIHNILIWFTIWWAQERTDRRYTTTLKPINQIALVINAVFILLHYLQTAVFYDGIAQDIPSWTAQYAVIVMLFLIMMMENRRRGIFFGKKVSFRKEFYHWLRQYHGYLFSFAVIYTFWFHPMVNTPGHLLGFLHVMLVMVQGSMMFTRAHVNRYWIFLNEILVLPHAALIAWKQGGGLIYMFLYGFLTVFIVTQMHGLGLKNWMKNLIYAGFTLSLVVTYTMMRETYQINEVIRIPFIDYVLIFLTYGIWLLIARVSGKIDSFRVTEPPPPVPAVGD